MQASPIWLPSPRWSETTESGPESAANTLYHFSPGARYNIRCHPLRVKGKFATGEEAFFRQFDNVTDHVMGEGYTWETQDRERDVGMAEAAWAQARALLQDETIDLVLLDELNIALKMELLDLPTVLEDLANLPSMQHGVIIGRGAPQDRIDIADTVTDMRKGKHASKAGMKAQQGVEL